MSCTNNNTRNKENQYIHLTLNQRNKIEALINQKDATGKRIFNNSYIADYLGVHQT